MSNNDFLDKKSLLAGIFLGAVIADEINSFSSDIGNTEKDVSNFGKNEIKNFGEDLTDILKF